MAKVHAATLVIRTLGFFADFGGGRHYQGNIRDAVREEPQANEDRVIEYLKTGHILLDVLETASDVLSGRQQLIGASSLLTDGKWVWRLDLPHYVANYHLTLPEEFLREAASQNYQIRPLTEHELVAIWEEVRSLLGWSTWHDPA